MKVLLKNTILLFCVLLLISCQTSKIVYIDQLQPSGASIKHSFKTLAIAENGLYRNSIFKDQTDLLTHITKDLASTNLLDAIVIVDSGRLINNPKSIEIPGDTAVNILNKMGTDALLNIYYTDSKIIRSNQNEPMMTFALISKLYIKNQGKPLDIIVMDSIIAPSYSDAYIIDEFNEYLKERVSTLVSQELLPHWKSLARIVYMNKPLKEGNKHFKQNNTDKAISSWQKVYDSNNKEEIKCKAALNITFALESKDQVDEAILWAQKALNNAMIAENIQMVDANGNIIISESNKLSYTAYIYLQLLSNRQKAVKQLDQLFNNN